MDELLHQVLTALRGMWRRRWVGLMVAWAVAVIGAVVLLRIPDRYSATARVYVDTQTVLKPLMSGLAVQPNIDEQIAMLARTLIARPNIEKIMRSSDLDVTTNTQLERDRLVDDITSRIKFTGAGGQVIVSTALTDDQEVVLRVRDTGPGMSEKDLEAALEPFRQAANALHWGGAGLGLPITKALVEANHARFGIASQVGDGTLVEVAFPTTRVLAQ